MCLRRLLTALNYDNQPKGETMMWASWARRLRSAGVIVILGLIAIGCATSKGTVDSFTQASYQPGSIDKIAIPNLRNANAAPSQARQVTRRVTRAITRKNPDVDIVTPNRFNGFLSDNDLVGKYANFIEDYNTSGIANRAFTEHLKTAGIDGILIGMISRVKQQDGTYGGNRGNTRVTLTFAIVDTTNNSVMWSASADGVKNTATTLEDAPPIAQAIKAAVDKIEPNLPTL